jgi:hypothetical protein
MAFLTQRKLANRRSKLPELVSSPGGQRWTYRPHVERLETRELLDGSAACQ